MNQNISLQIFDELGKAFDWHQISDFNCHGTKYLLSVDIKYFNVKLKNSRVQLNISDHLRFEMRPAYNP